MAKYKYLLFSLIFIKKTKNKIFKALNFTQIYKLYKEYMTKITLKNFVHWPKINIKNENIFLQVYGKLDWFNNLYNSTSLLFKQINIVSYTILF